MELNPFPSSEDPQPYRFYITVGHAPSDIDQPTHVLLSSPNNSSIGREVAAVCSLA